MKTKRQLIKKNYLVFIDFNKDLTAEINGFQQLP